MVQRTDGGAPKCWHAREAGAWLILVPSLVPFNAWIHWYALQLHSPATSFRIAECWASDSMGSWRQATRKDWWRSLCCGSSSSYLSTACLNSQWATTKDTAKGSWICRWEAKCQIVAALTWWPFFQRITSLHSSLCCHHMFNEGENWVIPIWRWRKHFSAKHMPSILSESNFSMAALNCGKLSVGFSAIWKRVLSFDSSLCWLQKESSAVQQCSAEVGIMQHNWQARGWSTISLGLPIVSKSWMSNRMAQWLPGLFWIAHIITWVIWTPWLAQAPSIGELPC